MHGIRGDPRESLGCCACARRGRHGRVVRMRGSVAYGIPITVPIWAICWMLQCEDILASFLTL